MLGDPLYSLSRVSNISHMVLGLHEKSHKQFEDDYERAPRRLYSAMSKALTLRDKWYWMSVSGEYLMIVPGDSKRYF